MPQETRLNGTKTTDAMFVLACRSLTMLRAKRSVEVLVENSTAQVELSTVEDASAVVAELKLIARGLSRLQIKTKIDDLLREGVNLRQDIPEILGER